MASKIENSDSSGQYRHLFRDHFMSHFKNPQLQQKLRESCVAEPAKHCPHLKEQFCKKEQSNADLDSCVRQKYYNPATSGGDADRMLNNYTYVSHDLVDSSITRHNNDNISLKHVHSCTKPYQTTLALDGRNSSRKYQTSAVEDCIGDLSYFLGKDSTLDGLGKYQTTAVEDCIGDLKYFLEKDSILDGIGNNSEGSAKSQKSLKTVVSRKSSKDLRKLVTSQCKLQEEIKETLNELDITQVENAEDKACGMQAGPSNVHPLACKRCSDRLIINPSQKDVMTEIGKGDFFDCRNTTTMTISVDDIINSRVINPIIHKLHRMYLKNLKEEMSLMEDLERLPNKVNEVYKSILLKQKD